MSDPTVQLPLKIAKPPFYTSAGFALLVASVAVTLFLAGAVVLLYLAKLPSSAIVAALGVLTSIAGPLLALLLVLLRQQFNVEVGTETAYLVKDHLEQHMEVNSAPNPPLQPGPGA